MGGLGNQMFQYATARSLAYRKRLPLLLDLSFLNANSNHTESFTARPYSLDIFLGNKITVPCAPAKRHLREIKENWQQDSIPEILHPPESRESYILSGYFQKYPYFQSCKDKIKQDFRFRYPLDAEAKQISEQIQLTNSVCIHVRRGDYIRPSTQAFHGIIDIDYIKHCIALASSQITNPDFYVFTDDPEWCNNHLPCLPNMVIASPELAGYKSSQHLQLMTKCKHFIISNSSYSWWAAWLSDYHKKTVWYPNRWYRNKDVNTTGLCPDDWIGIPLNS
jgi:hypothetical protein